MCFHIVFEADLYWGSEISRTAMFDLQDPSAGHVILVGHASSSLQSPQSLSPSQRKRSNMHRPGPNEPPLLHLNSPSGQSGRNVSSDFVDRTSKQTNKHRIHQLSVRGNGNNNRITEKENKSQEEKQMKR